MISLTYTIYLISSNALCCFYFFKNCLWNMYMPSQKSHDHFLNGRSHCKSRELWLRGSKWLQPLNVTRLHQKEPGYEARVWDQESTSPNRVGADMEVNSKFMFKSHGTWSNLPGYCNVSSLRLTPIKLSVTYEQQPDWQQECRNMEISTHWSCSGLGLGLSLKLSIRPVG